MTALSANNEAKRKDSEIQLYPVKGSAHIYKDSLLIDAGTGYAQPGDDGADYVFLGVAVEEADSSDESTDGTLSVRVYKTGSFEFTKADAAQTDIGTTAYIHDDQTVGSSSTNTVACGKVVEYIDSSTVRVRIDNSVN
jgi:hypothetical protein